MEEIIVWIPVLTSTLGSVVVSLITSLFSKKLFNNSKTELNGIKRRIEDEQRVSIDIRSIVASETIKIKELLEENKKVLQETKNEREELKKIHQEMQDTCSAMITIRNNLTTIKNQNTVALRRK